MNNSEFLHGSSLLTRGKGRRVRELESGREGEMESKKEVSTF